jgi:hypothetical protein
MRREVLSNSLHDIVMGWGLGRYLTVKGRTVVVHIAVEKPEPIVSNDGLIRSGATATLLPQLRGVKHHTYINQQQWGKWDR